VKWIRTSCEETFNSRRAVEYKKDILKEDVEWIDLAQDAGGGFQ
jgi:hypothetical protein